MRKLSDIIKSQQAKAAQAPARPGTPVAATPSEPTGHELTIQSADLLSVNAPLLDPSEPYRSYKINQRASGCFIVSEDGGVTNTDSGLDAIAGRPVDLSLVIAPAKRPSGNYTHDYRLRFAFFDGDGVLSELNLNAITVRDGVPSVSTAARCLIAALEVISETEDDMLACIDGTRFSLEPGTRATFINVALTNGDSWCAINSRAAFKVAPHDPAAFIAQICTIKARFRACNLLAASPAVIGSSPLLDAAGVITVEAAAV